MRFPISGVECSPLIPPVVAFVISCATAPAGVSGAFLLLPFQVSILGFTAPSVSPTNLVFNLIATPGGIYRYAKERRMAWPLALALIAGTLPGVFVGSFVRIHYLPDPRSFKLFAGCVLLSLGVRLFCDLRRGVSTRRASGPKQEEPAAVKTVSVSLTRVEYTFRHEIFFFNPITVLFLALLVGVAGGVYGVGGGAIIAPFLVSLLGLPMHTIAGATLLSTLTTSLAGVGCYELYGITALPGGVSVRPDWLLGALFGAGGLAGTYAGASLQKFLPEKWIRLLLGILVAGVAFGYIGQVVL